MAEDDQEIQTATHPSLDGTQAGGHLDSQMPSELV